MATTTGGTTYVTSTDLVANYPTASLALANRVDVVASGSMSKKTASYTVTVADILAGTTIVMNSASATVITLPSSSLVNGMRLNVFSVNTGAVTFTGGTVTGTVNSISSQYSGVSLTYDSAAAVWWCLPFSSGASGANFTNTATGTYTGYKYVTFTGNGSLVIDRAGFADYLIVAGGGGGAGGMIDSTQSGGIRLYLAAGTYTVTVGAGAGPQGTGNDSAITLTGLSATGGGPANTYAIRGGSGGGQGGGAAGAGVLYQGTNGSGNNGGGAGSAASGLAYVSTAGKASSIAGSTPTTSYTAGSYTFSNGASGGSGAGAANSGNGSGSGLNSGSGIVIIRVAV